MAEIAAAEQLTIDVCTRCHIFWFDHDELSRVSQIPPVAKPAPLAPVTTPRDAEPTADAEIGLEDGSEVHVTNPWIRLAHHMGAPVDSDGARVRIPIITIGAAALVFLGTLASTLLPEVNRQFGFLPGDPLRWAGLTIVLSPILQDGLVTGLLHVFFLAVLADNLEQFLGGPRLLTLLALAALAGICGHWLLHDGEALYVGAGPPGTALAVVFGLSFYPLYVRFFIGLYRPWHIFSVPAWLIVVLWMMVTVSDMTSGVTSEHFGAHLGAGLVGLVLWWTFHDHRPEPSSA